MTLEIDPAVPLWVTLGADALLYLHIGGGAVGLVAGTAALLLRKGGRAHRAAGDVFVAAMLIMAGIGAGVAPFLPERVSVLGGLITFYLVATAWLTVWRPAGRIGRLEALAAGASLGLLGLTAAFAWLALSHPSGTLDGQPWQAFLIFGVIAPLAAIGDLRLLLGRGIAGARRIARHLWRMCTALFIAATSYFLGQPDFVPGFMRGTAWVFVPPLATLLVMGYWLVRIWWRRLNDVSGTAIRRAELRRQVEHHQQPAEADVLTRHHAELKDLRLAERLAQPVEERVVDAVMIGGEPFRELDRDRFAR